MYLAAILLPLTDNHHQPLPRQLFQQVADELTRQFGGLTAHTRAPAEGRWRDGADDDATRDEIVIYEVLVEAIDRAWWAAYRRQLEARFRQEQVLIRAHRVEVL